MSDVNKYFASGAIKTETEKTFLLTRLQFIQDRMNAIVEYDANKKIPEKTKTKISALRKTEVNNQIDTLIKHIASRNGRQLDENIKSSLIDDLNLMKY